MPTAAKNRQARRAEARSNSDDYNADHRTERLTKANITIGEKVYHRRVKDNTVSRQILDLQEDQEIANRKALVLEKRMSELDDVDDEQWIELRGKVRAFTDEAMEKGYEVLAVVLQDENGDRPPIETIRGLEERVIVELTERLVGGGEPLDRPTPTQTSSG